MLVLTLGIALIPALGPLPPHRVLRDLDHYLKTEDLAVTVGDPTLSPAWRELLQSRLQPHLVGARPSRIWPLNTTGLQKIWIVACLLMGVNVLLTAASSHTAISTPSFVSPEETAAFEAMLEDWREVAPDLGSEEFLAILEEVEHLRGETDLSQESVAERMELLSNIEAIVEKHRRAQSEASISEHSEELANLLESVEGLSGAAAALRRGDFSAASQTLEGVAAALLNKGELPEGADSEDFQRRAEDLSERALQKGNPDLAKVLKNLANASAQQNPSGWCESAGALGKQMNEEGARALADRLMQAQLDQLEAQKWALSGQSPSQAASLSALLPGGNGSSPNLQAGAGRGADPYGGPTEPNGELETLALAGTPGQGDSVVETIRSIEAPTEALRTGGQATFEEYQALSTQAIQDESLPLVHRETIRRYFERIRPRTTDN
ncbi:MAG: hypothetical protein ACQKBT_01480 [Puniceicoccales bacterium]